MDQSFGFLGAPLLELVSRFFFLTGLLMLVFTLGFYGTSYFWGPFLREESGETTGLCRIYHPAGQG